MRANLRAHCLPETLFSGAIPEYDVFLQERRELMALKITQCVEAH